MENITRGHWIFAGIFLIVFIIAIVFAYRKDLKRLKLNYSKVWMVVLGIALVFLAIYFLYRL